MPPARRTLYLKIGVAGFAVRQRDAVQHPALRQRRATRPGVPAPVRLAQPAVHAAGAGLQRRRLLQGGVAGARHAHVTLDVPVALGLVVLFGRSVVTSRTGSGEGFLDSFAGLVFFLLIGRLFQQKAFDRIAFDRSLRSFLPLAARRATAAGWRCAASMRSTPGDVSSAAPQRSRARRRRACSTTTAIDHAFVTGEQAPGARFRRATPSAPAAALSVSACGSGSCAACHRAGWPNCGTTRSSRRSRSPGSRRFRRALASGSRSPRWRWRSLGAVAWWPDARMRVEVATAVLIIACPCALTLAAPITLGTAMGMLGQRGLLPEAVGGRDRPEPHRHHRVRQDRHADDRAAPRRRRAATASTSGLALGSPSRAAIRPSDQPRARGGDGRGGPISASVTSVAGAGYPRRRGRRTPWRWASASFVGARHGTP